MDQEEDDLEDERAFLIDQALDFRLSTHGKERTIVWRDFDGDEDELLEFVIDSKQVNEVTITIFEITYLQCVYEHAFRTSHERATEEDLDRLRYTDEAGQRVKQEQRSELDKKLENAGVGSKPTAAATSASANAASAGAASTVKSEPAIPATVAPAADTSGPQVDDSKALFSVVADLYLYDLRSQLFVKQEGKVEAKVLEVGRFLYWLSIHGADKVWLAQKVDADMNMNFSPEQNSAVWNYFTDDRQCFSWLLRFQESEAYTNFQKGYSQVIYETLNEEPWAKAKSDERAYAETAYEQGEPMDVDEMSESEGGDESVRTAKEEEEEDDEDEVAAALGTGRADSEDVSWPEEGQQDVNSLLSVGYKFDRSFVARGDKIGVFRHTEDNRLEHDTTINNVGTPSGKGFKPLKMMLHNQDAQMVLMDPGNKNAIYNMDLEYGKIVDEWKIHDDVQINNVVANSKYAQMTAERTMIGHSHNGIYRIDPRLSATSLSTRNSSSMRPRTTFRSQRRTRRVDLQWPPTRATFDSSIRSARTPRQRSLPSATPSSASTSPVTAATSSPPARPICFSSTRSLDRAVTRASPASIAPSPPTPNPTQASHPPPLACRLYGRTHLLLRRPLQHGHRLGDVDRHEHRRVRRQLVVQGRAQEQARLVRAQAVRRRGHLGRARVWLGPGDRGGV